MPQIDDGFVRRFTLTAIHVRRYKVLYVIALAWALMLLFVPAVRDNISPLGGGNSVTPATGVAAGGSSATRGASRGSGTDAATDLTEFITSTVEEDAGDSLGASGTGGTDIPDTPDAPSAAGAGLLPDELNPALLAVSPVVGEACNQVGTTALLIAIAGPSVPVPVPLSMVTPYLTNLYLACAEVPRLSPRGVCTTDAMIPNPVAEAGIPVALAPLGLLYDQIRAVEIAGTQAGAPNAGVAGTALAPAGCRPAGN